MTGESSCLDCGKTTDDAAPLGFCTRCLLKTAAMTAEDGDQIWATRFGSEAGAATIWAVDDGEGRPVAPGDVETLVLGGSLGGPDIEMTHPAASGKRIEPARFGNYFLIKRLGRGGMGVVYEARQISLNRRVALKRIRKGALASDKDLLRFRTEAQVIATLDHPHIVPIYEIGEHRGECFFSMKLFDGKDLRKRLAEFPERPEASARLMKTVADAVQYAHQRGVLHRDLKPSNILLDHDGGPQVIDFGLAVRVDSDADLGRSSVEGTPQYMAPEQASGDVSASTTMTDVYGMGAILYSLLTGEPPFDGETTHEVLRQVIEEPPEPPSSLAPGVDRDLEVICLKCLAKDPSQRYATARELSLELGRWLADEPIQARRYPWSERVLKWRRRRPVIAALSAALAVSVVVGVTGILWAMLLARASERKALDREELARREAYVAMINLGSRDYRDANLGHLAQLLADTEPKPGQSDLRGFEWHYLKGLTQQDRLTLRAGHPLRALDFSPDGTRVVAVGDSGTIQLWDAATGRLLQTMPSDDVGVRAVAYHPGGRWMATGSQDGKVTLWDAATARAVRTYEGHTGQARSVVFSPDGKRLASSGGNGKLLVWNVEDSRLIHDLAGHARDRDVNQVAYSRDGRWLGTTSDDRSIKIWDAVGGGLVRNIGGFEALPRCLDFHDDSSKLAAGVAGKILVFETESGKKLVEIQAEPLDGQVLGVDYSADGAQIASCGFNRVIRLWDAASGKLLRSFKGHAGMTTDVAFQPLQARVASAAGDGAVKFWGVDDEHDAQTFNGHVGFVYDSRFSPSGAWLASAGADGKILLWDANTRKVFRSLPGHVGPVTRLSISSDGAALASVGNDKTVRIWEVSTGRLMQTPNDQKALDCVQFSPDGKLLAFAGDDRDITLWDVTNQRPARILRGHLGTVRDLAFRPDGKQLASCGRDGRLRIWEVASGRLVTPGRLATAEQSGVQAVAYSPDGRWLATDGATHEIQIWDAQTGERARVLRGHMEIIRDVGFSPDGSRLASVGSDGTRLWEMTLGRELLAIEPHDSGSRVVHFSGDGKALLSAGSVVRIRGYRARP